MNRGLDVPFEEVAGFHGHVCPGLAIGYVMSRAALRALEAERADDEDLVAIVENDACGVDAVQYLTGCTFGKGNLIFRDYGKQVYTFYHRAGGRAVRVKPLQQSEVEHANLTREDRVRWLLSTAEADVVCVEDVNISAPNFARIRNSVTCAFCGERIMETRAHVREEKIACIPCSEKRNT